jgi:cytochrome P450
MNMVGRVASRAAPADTHAVPIEQIDVSDPMMFHRNEHWQLFKRLREEAPVHFCADSPYGPYWSITRYQDIVAVDTNHKVFSSHAALPLNETRIKGHKVGATRVGGFAAMDPPQHDDQRKSVSPGLAPTNLARLEGLMRERTRGLLSRLPVGEEFEWVDTVAIELTLLMLATLLDFPLEERGKLKRWSDNISGIPGDGFVESWDSRDAELKAMAKAFLELRDRRRAKTPRPDLISMMAHSPMAIGMSDDDFVSNMSLLIVGGNDTTRNSMSATILAFHQHPDQWAKLKADPRLIESGVPEVIRWHTPVMSMGRRALADHEIGGKLIRKGDKVMMWYVSGNRDETAICDPDRFIIDRERPRQHLSFGFGIHRCLGNRLAEMQLRVLWEEIVQQGWKRIEVIGTPRYAISHSLRGIDSLRVRIHA